MGSNVHPPETLFDLRYDVFRRNNFPFFSFLGLAKDLKYKILGHPLKIFSPNLEAIHKASSSFCTDKVRSQKSCKLIPLFSILIHFFIL